jgi:hypothetical protein
MKTPVKAITVLVTAAILGGLFVSGVSANAPAGAFGPGANAIASTVTAIASRWDHEERPSTDSTTPRALRWDHEERATSDTATPRASRWDHEER